jgi:nitrate reductase NapD
VNLSGILVVVPPERISDCIADLGRLSGVEVHHADPATGRLIVIQEAPDIEAEMTGFLAIRQRPHVLCAEMVYHYFAGASQDDIAELATLATQEPH